MIQLIIFILNTSGKFIGKLISNRGCLVSFLVFCVVFFYIIGKGAQERSYEIQKAHPELKKIIQDNYNNSSPGSGQHIAVILFWGSIIVLIALYIRSKFKKKDLAKGIGKPLPSKINKDLENRYSFKLQTQGENLILNNPFRGILCIGSAGSGKSESILRQLMKSAIDNEFCGIIYDFKSPTLTNELEGFLSQKTSRFKHYNINFNDLQRSNRVNPLDPRYIINASYAREFSTAIINNLLPESLEKKDFWVRSCTDVLAAIIFYLSRELPEYSTLPHAVALVLTDERKIIKLLSNNLQCSGMVKSLETALNNDSREQLSGVISTLQSAMSVLNTPEIFYPLSGNDFSLEVNNPADPIWLSLGNSPIIPETYSPVLSLIITVALKQMNQAGKHHSAIFLDEAPTLYIPKLEIIPATARSNKVSISFFAQDFSQIVSQYGQRNADVIISLLNNQFFGRVSSQKTAEYVSKLFGKTDQYFESHSQSRGSSSTITTNSKSEGTSKNFSIQERERIKPQDILQFDVGHFCGILVEGNNKEFNTRFKNISCEPVIMPERNFLFDVESNFRAIHAQIKELVQ